MPARAPSINLLVDASGIPLAVALTGGYRNDVPQLLPLLDRLHARPVKGKPGRPRQKPDRLLADRGYDHDKYRRLLWARGIKPIIAPRGIDHGSGLGRNGGSSSAASRTCTTSAACGSATSATPNPRRPPRARLLDPPLAPPQLIVKQLLRAVSGS